MAKISLWIAKCKNNNLEADSCLGRYYNFKKGDEYCEKRFECKFYEKCHNHLSNGGFTHELKTIKFPYIDDFRKCKRYIIE